MELQTVHTTTLVFIVKIFECVGKGATLPRAV